MKLAVATCSLIQNDKFLKKFWKLLYCCHVAMLCHFEIYAAKRKDIRQTSGYFKPDELWR